MSKSALVSDTSLLLYLDRLARIQLVPALFDPVYVPEEVVLELDAGRLLRPETTDVRKLGWATRVEVDRSAIAALPPNRLGPGERAVIAYARTHGGLLAGLDDRQARLLARQLGLMVTGTIGILVKSKRAGLIPCMRDALDALQKVGFWLSRDLYDEALQLADEV